MPTVALKLRSGAFAARPGLAIAPFLGGWVCPFLSRPLVTSAWHRTPWRGGFCCHWTEVAGTGSEQPCLIKFCLCGGGKFGRQASKSGGKYEQVGDPLGTSGGPLLAPGSWLCLPTERRHSPVPQKERPNSRSLMSLFGGCDPCSTNFPQFLGCSMAFPRLICEIKGSLWGMTRK